MSSLLIVLVLILEKCNYLYCLVGKNRDNYAKKKHPFCTALLLENKGNLSEKYSSVQNACIRCNNLVWGMC